LAPEVNAKLLTSPQLLAPFMCREVTAS